jgi:WbqC-like protein family
MARALVVSQPMFLPWIGLFEQVRLADVFVHYDDVQLPRGRSFMTRVQIKSAKGITWLSAPIDHAKSGKRINEVVFVDGNYWRDKHLSTLRHAYARTSHFPLMFAIAEAVYNIPSRHLSDFNIAAIEQIARWLGLSPKFIRSSQIEVSGTSTERLVNLCDRMKCDLYVTGHGALRYLDHQEFEKRGIAVRYVNYKKVPYPQGTGKFTPYVSIFDAIAHCGEQVRDLVCSDSVDWKDFTSH